MASLMSFTKVSRMSNSSNPKYDFTGKVALITGSSHPRGIGAAIGRQLAQCGAKLVVTGRDATNLAQVAQSIQQVSPSGELPLQIAGDLRNRQFVPKLIQQTLDHYGRLDILVNNAGGGNIHDAGFESPQLCEAFDTIMDVNVRSVLQITQLAVPYLEKTHGNIVNISSISGEKNEPAQFMIYCMSKAALNMQTKCAASQLAAKGIRVNAVSPGPIYTAGGRMVGDEHYFENNQTLLENKIPLGRIGQPDEVANVVLFLASEEAANMTGSIVVTDGGLLVK